MPKRILPRGYRVICAFPITDIRIYIFKDMKVTYTEDDTKLFLECFVSGHTIKEGLSIVALDNPEYCLSYYKDPSDEHIDRIASGYYNWWCVEGLERGNVCRCHPICPF